MFTTAENKELVYRYLEALSGKPKPESVLREYLADEELIEHILASEAELPEYEIITEDVLAEGDLVAVRAHLLATHLGPFMGIEPTGRKIDLEFFINYRIANSKIVDHWMIIDSGEMMKQLGVEAVRAAR